jgi:hypothetical protein
MYVQRLVILMLHYVACVYVRKVVARRQELGKFFLLKSCQI